MKSQDWLTEHDLSLTFDKAGRLWKFRPQAATHGHQPVDARIADNAIEITVTVPGMESGDVDLHATDEVLDDPWQSDYTMDLAATSALPSAVDLYQLETAYADDVLEIRVLPSAAPASPSSRPSRWPADSRPPYDRRPSPRRNTSRGPGHSPEGLIAPGPPASMYAAWIVHPRAARQPHRAALRIPDGVSRRYSRPWRGRAAASSGRRMPNDTARQMAIEAKYLRPRLDHVTLRPGRQRRLAAAFERRLTVVARPPATARPPRPPPPSTTAAGRRRGTSSTSSTTTRSRSSPPSRAVQRLHPDFGAALLRELESGPVSDIPAEVLAARFCSECDRATRPRHLVLDDDHETMDARP